MRHQHRRFRAAEYRHPDRLPTFLRIRVDDTDAGQRRIESFPLGLDDAVDDLHLRDRARVDQVVRKRTRRFLHVAQRDLGIGPRHLMRELQHRCIGFGDALEVRIVRAVFGLPQYSRSHRPLLFTALDS
ncbi:hypothetical protein GD416_27385 [Burkholderia sp. BE24]|nr:hypothetical protein [Burkholderia sp. BE24]